MNEPATRRGPLLLPGMLACGLAFWLSAASAQAQTPDEKPSGERPWARGVSEEHQNRALEIFSEGTAFLDEGLFKLALEKYREAIALWDHPSIRYNMVVCHINLAQPIDAYENVEAALRWGPEPLDRELFAQALTYKRLLEGQLVRLTARCGQPGIKVTLDGRGFIDCPGEQRKLLEAGMHQLSAEKSGFLPRTYRLNLVGGRKRDIAIELIPLDSASVTTRRWDAWKPWAVTGAGVALALAGAIFEVRSAASYDKYDRSIAAQCGAVPCAEDHLLQSVRDDLDRARLQNTLAIGMLASGGLAIATGVTLLVLNRPKTSYQTYPVEGGGGQTLVPLVDRSAVGLSGRFSF